MAKHVWVEADSLDSAQSKEETEGVMWGDDLAALHQAVVKNLLLIPITLPRTALTCTTPRRKLSRRWHRLALAPLAWRSSRRRFVARRVRLLACIFAWRLRIIRGPFALQFRRESQELFVLVAQLIR